MDVEKRASLPHIVLFTLEAWGHVRPLCSFAAKLLSVKTAYITFFTTNGFVDRTRKELSRHIPLDHGRFQDLVRIVGLGEGNMDNTFSHELYPDFSIAFEKLVKEKPLNCSHCDAVFDAIPSPDVAIFDIFHPEPMQTARDVSFKPLKIYIWYPVGAGIFSMFAPVEKGGAGDPRIVISAEAEKSGRSIEEIAHEVFFNSHHQEVTPPGLPTMYNHEMHPQEVRSEALSASSWLSIFDSVDIADGIFILTADELEPQASSVLKAWLGKETDSAFPVGPLLPPPEVRKKVIDEDNISERAADIDKLMDSVLERLGNDSLLLISFGSIFWPLNAEKIWAALDLIMEKGVPFVMCCGSYFADIPNDIREKVEKYSLGIMSHWGPQQAILNHPVTGWFLSHCGQNSCLESIIAGIPMICWPFYGDQAFNAANLTENFGVAYELFEVRTGAHGLRDSYRLGRPPIGTIEAFREELSQVLDLAFNSDDGKQKRENMKKLQKTISSCWDEGGSSKAHFDRFVKTLEV
ncbi:Plant UDP-glycosyltransferase [Abortiporus biennis]